MGERSGGGRRGAARSRAPAGYGGVRRACSTAKPASPGVGRTHRRRLDGSTARRLDGSTARRLDGSTARRLDGSTARRLDGSTARRLDGSTARRLDGSTARRLIIRRASAPSVNSKTGPGTEITTPRARSKAGAPTAEWVMLGIAITPRSPSINATLQPSQRPDPREQLDKRLPSTRVQGNPLIGELIFRGRISAFGEAVEGCRVVDGAAGALERLLRSVADMTFVTVRSSPAPWVRAASSGVVGSVYLFCAGRAGVSRARPSMRRAAYAGSTITRPRPRRTT